MVLKSQPQNGSDSLADRENNNIKLPTTIQNYTNLIIISHCAPHNQSLGFHKTHVSFTPTKNIISKPMFAEVPSVQIPSQIFYNFFRKSSTVHSCGIKWITANSFAIYIVQYTKSYNILFLTACINCRL
jgi:hypothetical protein